MKASLVVSTDREIAALKPDPDGRVIWAVVESCPGLRVKVGCRRRPELVLLISSAGRRHHPKAGADFFRPGRSY